MGLTHGEEYRARAEECYRLAEATSDAQAKDAWLKLAKSWQALADSAEKTYKIIPPTSQ